MEVLLELLPTRLARARLKVNAFFVDYLHIYVFGVFWFLDKLIQVILSRGRLS